MTKQTQIELWDDQSAVRSMLDALLEDAKLYKTTDEFKRLLSAVSKMRNFAPFNAMLLQLQKPGLSYAASKRDWLERFGRAVKSGSRPLLVLWPFGPVALVYDVQDTEGKALPSGFLTFSAEGNIDAGLVDAIAKRLSRRHIFVNWVDHGEHSAGAIKSARSAREDQRAYEVSLNKNHSPVSQFSTMSHELAHLMLGHLGPDKHLKIPNRGGRPTSQEELEAESVAYLVCERLGIKARSDAYLANFLPPGQPLPTLDIYQIMRAAGEVEKLLGTNLFSLAPAHEDVDEADDSASPTNSSSAPASFLMDVLVKLDDSMKDLAYNYRGQLREGLSITSQKVSDQASLSEAFRSEFLRIVKLAEEASRKEDPRQCADKLHQAFVITMAELKQLGQSD